MKKLAIIIPVYNTSKYLEKCIKSIEAQKLDDYEVIIVDDCSWIQKEKILSPRICTPSER